MDNCIFRLSDDGKILKEILDKSVTHIEIPNGVVKIYSWALSGCKDLESISIPNSVNNLESNTFMDCISLKSIDIPNSISEIKRSLFYG